MEFSEFALRIVLLFLPGLIAFYLVVDKLTAHRPFKPHAIAIYSLLLGFYSYVIYAVVLDVIRPAGSPQAKVSFIEALTDPKASLDLFEIIVVSAFAIPLGLVVTFAINHSWLHRCARVLHVTRKFGDLDVWSYVMNSDVEPWVVIRDREYDLMYEGWIEAFSDTSERDEILLRDVRVYRNSTAEQLYDTPALYLPRRRNTMTVEFPAVNAPRSRGVNENA